MFRRATYWTSAGEATKVTMRTVSAFGNLNLMAD